MNVKPTLLVATGNPGKLREYAGLLHDAPFRLLSLKDVGITQEVDESGGTFAENAWLKASGYAAMSGMLTLADDSGLEVDALGGDPGVHSARYGGDACSSDTDRVSLLLRNMNGVPWGKRTARFRCVINVAQPFSDSSAKPELLAVRSWISSRDDTIRTGRRRRFRLRSSGLSTFIRPDCGPVSLQEKNRISHRGSAAVRAMRALTQLPCYLT